MDIIRDNVSTLRDSIQRNQFMDTTVIDVFTAFYVILQKRMLDFSIGDDKHFAFVLGCLRNVPAGSQRKYWLETMFTTYEKLSGVTENDPNRLLLKANLVYLSPLSAACYP
jgi:hypothetical protein